MFTRSTARLGMERLEEREVPAITILVDYSLDLRANGGSGFFQDHPDAKATLNRVAYEMGQRVTANFAAISASGSNSWSALFYNPENGKQYSLPNLAIAANTIIVYVGGRDMPGTEAGQGGYGGYSYSGTGAWGNTIAQRGWSGFSLWGGSIAFDTTANWHYGLTTSDMTSNELDFYSVCSHEMGHVLGFGTAPQWFNKTTGSNFVGSNVESVYGGPAPIDLADPGHWADGLKYNGQYNVMDPVLNYDERRTWTNLDEAALRDIGWAAGVMVSPPTVPPPPPPPTPPPVTLPPVGGDARAPVLVSGSGDGKAYVYASGSDGNLAYTGRSFQPFAGFTGAIRTAVGDFDGDGIADFVFATGPGTGAKVRIVNGASGADILAPTTVLGGFGGGAFVAAGDLDRDGKAELTVSADAGGLPAVQVFRLSGGQLTPITTFLPILSSSLSGIRVAMGDINHDGAADLVIAAGAGWSPRVRIYDGAALANGKTVQIVPGFFAFAWPMGGGVNVAVGDVNGDGYDDLIVSQDNGGTSKVRIWSGATITANPTALVGQLPTYQTFFANGLVSHDGIRIVARDIDGDGKAELITSAAGGSLNWLRVLAVSDTAVDPLAALLPFGAVGALNGVYVG